MLTFIQIIEMHFGLIIEQFETLKSVHEWWTFIHIEISKCPLRPQMNAIPLHIKVEKRNEVKKQNQKNKNKKIKTPNLIWEYNFKAIGMDSKTDYRRKDY